MYDDPTAPNDAADELAWQHEEDKVDEDAIEQIIDIADKYDLWAETPEGMAIDEGKMFDVIADLEGYVMFLWDMVIIEHDRADRERSRWAEERLKNRTRSGAPHDTPVSLTNLVP